jgi:alpha-galactosidase
MQTAHDLIALYKEIRPLVQRGELYRLKSAEANVVANEYTSDGGGQAAVFLFQKRRQFGEDPAPVRPAGLHPDAVYRVSVLDPGTVTVAGQKLPMIHAAAAPVLRSGRYLMQKGFELHMKGDDTATLVLLQAQ